LKARLKIFEAVGDFGLEGRGLVEFLLLDILIGFLW